MPAACAEFCWPRPAVGYVLFTSSQGRLCFERTPTVHAGRVGLEESSMLFKARNRKDSPRRGRSAVKGYRPIEALEARCLLAAHIAGDATVYSTIQAAVDAARPGAVIDVDAGTYSEDVVIWTPVTIRGAQAGVDARSNTRLAGARNRSAPEPPTATARGADHSSSTPTTSPSTVSPCRARPTRT